LPFATVPIKEIENTAVSLEKLFGADALKIEKLILNTNSTSDRINYLEVFLLNRLATVESIDYLIKSTIETILTANGQVSVDELSKQININLRQLERKFSSTIGLSPKQLSKIIRVQTTLKMLITKKVTSLTSVAYEGEYYDKAHFIKDFKEFTSFTPKEFYRSSLK
jgi:AraC-like DNA-binding protein